MSDTTPKQRWTTRLVLKARAGDARAKTQLLAECDGLCRLLATRNNIEPYDFDDMLQLARIGVLHAIEKYDPKRGAFKTIAGLYIRREIGHERLRVLRSHPRSRAQDAETIELLQDIKPHTIAERDAVQNSVVFSDMLRRMPPRYRTVTVSLIEGQSQAQTAQHMNISPVSVSRLTKYVADTLTRELASSNAD